MWVCVVFCVLLLLLLLLFLHLFCLSLNIYQCAVNVTLFYHFSQSILQSDFYSRTLMSVCKVYPLQIHSFTICTCYLVFYLCLFLSISNSLCDDFFERFQNRFFLFKCHPNWHCIFLLLFLLPFLQLLLLLLLCAIFVLIFSFRIFF